MKNFSLLLGLLIVIFACSTTDDKTAGANIEIPLDPAFLNPTDIAGTWVLPSATKTSTTSINISNTAGKNIFSPADMLLTGAKIGVDFSVPLDQVVTFTLKALNSTPAKQTVEFNGTGRIKAAIGTPGDFTLLANVNINIPTGIDSSLLYRDQVGNATLKYTTPKLDKTMLSDKETLAKAIKEEWTIIQIANALESFDNIERVFNKSATTGSGTFPGEDQKIPDIALRELNDLIIDIIVRRVSKTELELAPYKSTMTITDLSDALTVTSTTVTKP